MGKRRIELLNRVNDAIATKSDPWQRMEIACVAHITGLLDWRRANQVLFVMPPWHYPESIKARVIALRDDYEDLHGSYRRCHFATKWTGAICGLP